MTTYRDSTCVLEERYGRLALCDVCDDPQLVLLSV